MNRKRQIAECEDCTARCRSIFDDLSAEEKSLVSENKGANLYRRGQNIFYEGTRPSGLYCINSGKVKIYKINSYGKEQIVRLAKSGDLLGYRSLISGDRYCSFASPLEDAMICFIPKEIFFKLFEQNGKLSVRLIKMLSEELKLAEQHVADMAQKPVRERLAEALLMLKEYYGTTGNDNTLDISITREDLANLVGTATETTIRFLSEFKNDGFIVLEGRKIKILDHRALTKIAHLYD